MVYLPLVSHEYPNQIAFQHEILTGEHILLQHPNENKQNHINYIPVTHSYVALSLKLAKKKQTKPKAEFPFNHAFE